MTDDTIPGLAEEYWEAQLEASPLFATYMGDHRYDDRVDDLTAEAEQARRATWSGLKARATAVDGALDETDTVTRDLLVHELDDALRGIDLRLAEMTWDQMEGVHADLLISAGQLNAPSPSTRRWPWSAPGATATCWPRRPSAGARAWPQAGLRPA